MSSLFPVRCLEGRDPDCERENGGMFGCSGSGERSKCFLKNTHMCEGDLPVLEGKKENRSCVTVYKNPAKAAD